MRSRRPSGPMRTASSKPALIARRTVATRRLRGRSLPPEDEAQFGLAFAFRGDLAVDLFCVIAPLGDGLRPGCQACLDLQDFRSRIFGRVDPGDGAKDTALVIGTRLGMSLQALDSLISGHESDG